MEGLGATGVAVTFHVDPETKLRLNVATIESKNFLLRPMVVESLRGRAEMILPKDILDKYLRNDVEEFFELRRNPDNCRVYATTKPASLEAVVKVVSRDAKRGFIDNNPYTGYAIFDTKTMAFLGRGADGAGYLPSEDGEGEGVYKAAPLDEGGGEGPAEVQMGDFIVDSTRSREQIYHELIKTLLVAASHFVEAGILQNGQRVKRITVTVIDPSMGYFSGDEQKELAMRAKVLEIIFGAPLGFLPPDDRRNYSEHRRLVYGCEAEAIRQKLVSMRSVRVQSDLELASE